MIYLTSEFAPSALFCGNDLAAPFKYLLERAAQYREDPRKALQYAQEAQALSRETRACVEQAAALVHLSDFHREAGRLGPALLCAQEAYDILRRQPGQSQRHNEAIAAYDLGLLHQLLGNDTDALNWYQVATQLLESAQEYWTTHNETNWSHRCTDLEQLLHRLTEHLAHEEHGGLILLARLVGAQNGHFSVVELKVNGYRLGERLAIGDRTFRLLAPSGDLVLAAEEEYRVFQVPDSACIGVGAKRGDYVLAQKVERGAQNVPYVVVGAAEPDFAVHFQRDATGMVSFESLVTRRIIGDLQEDNLSIYRPIALLRPEN